MRPQELLGVGGSFAGRENDFSDDVSSSQCIEKSTTAGLGIDLHLFFLLPSFIVREEAINEL